NMTGPVDVEEMLARFRDWLREARTELEETNHELAPTDAEVHEVGLYQLVEEFTALRHELKLETKSSRILQEQTQSAVAALGQATEQSRAVEPKEAQAAGAAGKSLAEALADLDEALDRGRTEIERARRRIVDESGKAIESALEGLLSRASWFQRRTLRAY